MSNESGRLYTAFRYMTRFRCIGSECESSCCSGGWQITIDRDHYKRTKQALSGSHEGRQEFDSKMKLVKKVTGQTSAYALVVLQNNGDCSFLDGERMCSLQKRYGEELLSDTCSIYPRALNLSGQRRELAGLSSCPEVARQLLLHEDAMELDRVEPASVGRPIMRRRLDDHPQDAYTRYHDELRNLMVDLLGDRRFPLSTRLSFVAYFGARTAEFLRRGEGTLDEERLLAEVERIQDGALRDALHVQLGELAVDPNFPARAMLAIVSSRASHPMFRELLDAVLPQYGAGSLDSGSLTVEIPAWNARYAQHKSAFAPYAARIDGYFMNYASNYWAREWYEDSANLLEHQVRLLVRIATLRFLLFGHPLLAASLRGELAPEEALDRAVVHVVQVFSRVFDHAAEFRNGLHRRLASAQVLSLAHAVCLAHF